MVDPKAMHLDWQNDQYVLFATANHRSFVLILDAIGEAKPSELESALVALGLADYVAARLMVDIAEQKTQQV